MMGTILTIFTLIISLLWPSVALAAFSFQIDSLSKDIIISKDEEVEVVLSITDLPSESYFRVGWQKGSGNYFGWIKNDLGNWVEVKALSDDCKNYYHVTNTSATSLVLVTKIGEIEGIENGEYKIKAHRFTTGCTNYPSNDLAISVSLPTPTPTPTPSPTQTSTPTPVPTSTPTPTPYKTSTPKPIATSTPGVYVSPEGEQAVLGIQEENTPVPSSSPEPAGEKNLTAQSGKFPLPALLFILGGVGFVGAGVFPFAKAFFGRYTRASDEKIS